MASSVRKLRDVFPCSPSLISSIPAAECYAGRCNSLLLRLLRPVESRFISSNSYAMKSGLADHERDGIPGACQIGLVVPVFRRAPGLMSDRTSLRLWPWIRHSVGSHSTAIRPLKDTSATVGPPINLCVLARRETAISTGPHFVEGDDSLDVAYWARLCLVSHVAQCNPPACAANG